ncbi:bifunctional diguanylate cyclase/phosphodiesterase [Methylomarinum vadi]|uniref:bifunctional diguanylate cyclase/phosphodiesterase n=1 Tax=Methylomarinum vadi TaxID=438855 RepID=UPI0004DF7141|nr:LapD/MoxY N-terminal periplasmic domain-containing protein [Methylomarinum vadi]
MSLSKQLVILISLLFLLIFSINFVLSVRNIKTYLEGEASIHAQDTATSLGLSLSPYLRDEQDPVIETMIQAIFDRGYYREIRLVNVDGKELVELRDDQQIKGVPEWFIEWLPMKLAEAQSEISTGWQVTGTVSVTVNPGYAYHKLYEQVKSAFYYSAAVFAAALILLLLALRMALRSLKQLEQLAVTIADGHFSTIDNIPWTTEVRNLTQAMNSMSQKVAAIIDKLQLKLKDMGDQMLRDDLTGLHKKEVFENDLRHLFMEDSEAYIYIVKLDSLTRFVNEQGYEKVDRYIQDFAELLENCCRQLPKGVANCYRFYGAEFVMLLRSGDINQARQCAEQLSTEFARFGRRYQKNDVAHIGVAPYCAVTTADTLLESAYEAYEQARIIGSNGYFIRTSQKPARDIAAWKELVFECIDLKRYELEFVSRITSFHDDCLLMEEAFTRAYDGEGEPIAMATFISIAEKFAKIVTLETQVTDQVLSFLLQRQCRHALAVNLSTRTVKSAEFRAWLGKRLKSRPQEAGKLVFSLTAYAVAKEEDVYRAFIEFVHELGAKVIIKRLDPQSMSVSLCKALKPDYIRLAREIGQHIDEDPKKQAFVKTLAEVSELLNITLFAEDVAAEEDCVILKGMGITGASR